MSSHDASVVDTVQKINGILAVNQIEEEDAYVDFDAVYEDTFGSYNQFSEHQWRFSYGLDSDTGRNLVDYANRSGGSDNITLALYSLSWRSNCFDGSVANTREMSISDQKIHREILSFIYEEMKDDLRRDADLREMVEEFEDLGMDELRYHIERLQDNRQVEYRGKNHVQITVEGVEKLDREGYETLLDTDLRYEILRKAYEEDRGNTFVYIDGDSLFDELSASAEEIKRNLWYLSGKGLIDRSGMSNDFQLEGEGRDRYEQYRDEGIPIPRTHPLQRYTQHTIEQGDREKAENVFRDIVEVAREEVIVVDMYAKGRLYDLLESHVPSVVDVKILGSHKEIGEENIELYREFAEGKDGDVELRYLDYWEDYPFHSREVIRDREAGWVWDHTFADAGGRHHTISQLRPVNLENDLEVFDEAWEEAETVE